MNKKVVLAMVNGSLCIDPSDVENVNLTNIKASLKEKYGKEIPIVVAPISTWMPDCGTEAVMDLASKEMAERAIKSVDIQKSAVPERYGNNRHMRRMMAKINRKRKAII